MHHFILQYDKSAAIIDYNAVRVGNTSRQKTQTISSANRQSFLRIYARLKGTNFMAVSYIKLWKRWIDKDMKKKDLCEKAGISSSSVTKMGKTGHVTTEVLLKICTALDCGVNDIMEIIPE